MISGFSITLVGNAPYCRIARIIRPELKNCCIVLDSTSRTIDPGQPHHPSGDGGTHKLPGHTRQCLIYDSGFLKIPPQSTLTASILHSAQSAREVFLDLVDAVQAFLNSFS